MVTIILLCLRVGPVNTHRVDLTVVRPRHGTRWERPGALDLANCPTTDAELTCQLAAAFASDPDPCRKSPLRVATSTMAAREQRNLFIDTPFLKQAMFV